MSEDFKNKRPRYRVEAEGTTNTYVYCWNAARKALVQAETLEADLAKRQAELDAAGVTDFDERKSATKPFSGSFYFAMAAAVFSAFTVEAFLNHVGLARMPDWATRERSLKTRDKFEVLAEHCGWTIDRSKRPHQTLQAMFSVRNALGHGKTETVAPEPEVVKRYPDDSQIRWPAPDWVELCALDSVQRMVADAGAVVRDLSKQSGDKGDPFESTGHGSGSIGLAER